MREAAALEASYLADARADRAPAFYVDGFLSDEALEELYEWCLDATVWFDAKPGYLGAYFDDGFSPKVSVSTAIAPEKLTPSGKSFLCKWIAIKASQIKTVFLLDREGDKLKLCHLKRTPCGDTMTAQ